MFLEKGNPYMEVGFQKRTAAPTMSVQDSKPFGGSK
jgi:hypothetical protein